MNHTHLQDIKAIMSCVDARKLREGTYVNDYAKALHVQSSVGEFCLWLGNGEKVAYYSYKLAKPLVPGMENFAFYGELEDGHWRDLHQASIEGAKRRAGVYRALLGMLESSPSVEQGVEMARRLGIVTIDDDGIGAVRS